MFATGKHGCWQIASSHSVKYLRFLVDTAECGDLGKLHTLQLTRLTDLN